MCILLVEDEPTLAAETGHRWLGAHHAAAACRAESGIVYPPNTASAGCGLPLHAQVLIAVV